MEEEGSRVTASCRKCGHETRMTVARLKAHNRICNRCMNAERDADAARYLARKWADRMRRRGEARPYPGVSFVRQVIARHNTTQMDAVRRMFVVLRDPSQGVTLDNAVLVTSSECSALSRARSGLLVEERIK
jgi:hypothetical protein